MKITVQIVLHADDDTETVVGAGHARRAPGRRRAGLGGFVPGLRNPAPSQGMLAKLTPPLIPCGLEVFEGDADRGDLG